ncbi:MAG: polysaccharide pyruvyl transferase family protein [Flavisolibacter sp.]
MFPSLTQVKHVTRNIHQRLNKVQVGIIGGYHGGNLGDMALGYSVMNILSSRGITSGLQTIYNLNKWPRIPYAIVGGGAVGYMDCLNELVKRYRGNYKNIALLGVDFNEPDYSSDYIDLIREAAFVSCRSKAQAGRLMDISGRSNIDYHPDLAFSLLNEFCNQKRIKIKNTTSKKLLVNIVPLYGKLSDGTISPLSQYSSERPNLYRNFSRMQESYKKIIRETVSNAIDEGYKVESLPFTGSDAEYARIILDGLPVRHIPYNSNPIFILKYMLTADWVLATRYHATIFGLKAGIKLSPIAYATKNELMLQELGIERSNYLTTDDLANGIDQAPEPVMVSYDKIKAWEQKSVEAINKCIDTMQLV